MFFVAGKKTDKGYTLVELVVVISIMVILTGIISVSVSLIYSKDSDRAATMIEDALSEARMLSMSKADVIKLIIKTNSDSTKNTIEIWRGTETDPYKTYAIDRSVKISLSSVGDTVSASPGDSITIIFNKSNGSVEEIKDATPANNALYEIKSVSQRGRTKTTTVILVANTGRHYIEK